MNQKITILLVVVVIVLVGAVAFLLGERGTILNDMQVDDEGEEMMEDGGSNAEAGVTVPVPDVEELAEGLCFIHGDCYSGEYCKFDNGTCGGRGTCTARPEVCTKQYDPVCSCDGETFGNSCEAASDGASISRQGAC